MGRIGDRWWSGRRRGGDGGIWKDIFIESDVTRNQNTARGGIVTTRALVIIGGSKIKTWKRARFELVFGGGGDIWET